MLAEAVEVGERLHMVLLDDFLCLLLDLSVARDLGTVESALQLRVLPVAPVEGAGRVELQEVGQGDVRHEGAVQLVEPSLVVVVTVCAQGVSRREEGTRQSWIVGGCHAVVILRVTVAVGAHLRIAVRVEHPDVDGVDGCDERRVVHQVGVVPRGGAEVRVRPGGRVGITHVGGELEPRLRLVVRLEAGGKTLVARKFDHAVLVEVVHVGIEGAFVHRSRCTDVVLLTEGGVVGSVAPVVVRQVVGLSVRLVGTTQRGVRVQLAVGADEQLSVGHGVDVVAQVVEHVLVRLLVCLCRSRPTVGEVAVVLSVEGLVVEPRVGDGLIVLHRTGVGTPLHVDIDLGDLVLAGLCRDDDDTGGTARTVEGSGSGVLEDGHRLDVLLRDVVQRGAVGRSVDDDKGLGLRVERGDTADLELGVFRPARRAHAAAQLESRRTAHEGIGHVGRHVLRQFFRTEHGCRPGERRLLLCTESDDHHFIELLGVCLQFHTDESLTDGDLLRLHADEGH